MIAYLCYDTEEQLQRKKKFQNRGCDEITPKQTILTRKGSCIHLPNFYWRTHVSHFYAHFIPHRLQFLAVATPRCIKLRSKYISLKKNNQQKLILQLTLKSLARLMFQSQYSLCLKKIASQLQGQHDKQHLLFSPTFNMKAQV